MELNPIPLEDGKAEPGDPYLFAKNLGIDEQTLRAYKLCDKAGRHGPLTRDELRLRCDSAESDDEIRGAILSVLAWGGMSHGNPDKFWNQTNGAKPLISVIREMRCGGKKLDPVDAFMLFHKAWAAGELPYLRISFYTKILFFFFPGSPGTEAPILDQFVAKSLDVLFDPEPGNPSFTGPDDFPRQSQNAQSARVGYRRYLDCLDMLRQRPELRAKAELTRSQIERLLFRPGAWRNYVASSLKN